METKFTSNVINRTIKMTGILFHLLTKSSEMMTWGHDMAGGGQKNVYTF